MMMTGDRITGAQLLWPGSELGAFGSDDGWIVADREKEPTFKNRCTTTRSLSSPGKRAAVVLGQRLDALDFLVTQVPAQVSLAYLDLPRLKLFKAAEDATRLPTWLTIVKSHITACLPLLATGERIVAHIDDDGAPYVRVILEDI